jgi:Protein of unknown function (DUF3999)
VRGVGALASLFLACAAAAAPPRFERDVTPSAKGPSRLPVDVPLLSGAAPLERGTRNGLSDLRFFTKEGTEVPYLLVGPPRGEPVWAPARVLPIASTKTTSGFEADLGRALLVDRLNVLGLPAPFLKRVRLEGSGDRARWTLLVDEGTLFDLPEEKLERNWLAFPPGELRYFRLTWDDTKSGRVPMPKAVSARQPGPGATAPPLRVPMTFEKRGAERGRSRYRVRLPAPRLPIESIELAPDAENVLRKATVTELHLAGSELVPVTLGSATLRRAARDGLHADALAIPVSVPSEPEVEIVVEDGDNPPLALREIAAVFAPLPWIYLESPGTAPLVARFGVPGPSSAPRYDLEAERSAVESGSVAAAPAAWGERHASAGTAAAVPQASPIAPGAELEVSSFRFWRPLPEGPPGLTSLLLDAHVLANAPALGSLRIAGEDGHQVPYVLESRGDTLRLELPPLTPAKAPGDSAAVPPRSTFYRVELPLAGLPPATLVVPTGARVFTRSVVLFLAPADADRREDDAARQIASTVWAHADPETDAPPLALSLPILEARSLLLAIGDGDNAPLPLGRPTLELPARRLRFFRPAGALRLLYGDDSLSAPTYDLALLAPRFLAEPAHDLALTGEPPAPAPEKGPMGKTLFWAILVGAVVALLLVIARLVGKGEPART